MGGTYTCDRCGYQSPDIGDYLFRDDGTISICVSCMDTAATSTPPSSEGAEAPTDDEEVEMIDCEACGEEKPEEGSESVVVHTHRIEGRAVATDTERICRDCLDEAEEGELDRQLDAREWAGYDAWEEKATMGIDR